MFYCPLSVWTIHMNVLLGIPGILQSFLGQTDWRGKLEDIAAVQQRPLW